MTIVVSENTVAMWSIQIDSTMDWLAHLSRTEQPDKFHFIYRLRTYVDDKIFDSEDRKSWREGTLTGPEPEVLRKLRVIFEELLGHSTAMRGWELLRGQRSVEEFLDALTEMPNMTSKVLP
jgi:hypothetical protein